MASDLPAGLQGFDLDGRVAVVTGASSGLGGAVARGLASVGARVAVVARRVDRLESLAAEIGGVAVGCDLLDADQVRRVVPEVAARLGGPEILVSAAGNRFGRAPAEHEELRSEERRVGKECVSV